MGGLMQEFMRSSRPRLDLGFVFPGLVIYLRPMRWMATSALVIIGGLAAGSAALAQQSMVGKPSVTGGDTIRIGQTHVRLDGVDAPEAEQMCRIEGKEWACGKEAKLALTQIIGTRWVTCFPTGKEEKGLVVAQCYAGPADIAALLVREGMALADRRHSTAYVIYEDYARRGRKGVWRGTFQMPWEWRGSRQ